MTDKIKDGLYKIIIKLTGIEKIEKTMIGDKYSEIYYTI